MKRALTIGGVAVLCLAAGLMVGAQLASSGKPHSQQYAAREPAGNGAKRILYWWDPMIGPSSISPKPGISAMGMKLVPVYAASGSNHPGEVIINPAIEQNLAVQTSVVQFGALHKTVRTVGYFRQATPLDYAVTMRVSGWIGTLTASTNGTAIRQGDPLFTLYSPQLLAAEEQLLAAAKNRALVAHSGDAGSVLEARTLYDAIRSRLIYLGVSAAELDRIVARSKPEEYLSFHSPVSGYLTRVSLRQKSFIRSGQTVMRIAQLRRVWLDARVYESQLPWVRLGQRMEARLAADPGRTLEGRIDFIAPNENPQTHTVTVRAGFSNPSGLLRPGMYALVEILTTPAKRVLLAPASAVIHTGTGEIVLVALGKGHFAPRAVTTGLTGSDDQVQILSGLKAGERVVTSGQFLIDVESNMTELATKLTAGTAAGAQATGASTGGKVMRHMAMRPAAKQRDVGKGRPDALKGRLPHPKTGR